MCRSAGGAGVNRVMDVLLYEKNLGALARVAPAAAAAVAAAAIRLGATMIFIAVRRSPPARQAEYEWEVVEPPWPVQFV